AIAAALEQGPAASLLGPTVPIEAQPSLQARVLPDIAALAGFRAFEVDLGPGRGYQTVPASLLTAELAEQKEYFALVARTPAGPRPLAELASTASILLAGTSFSVEGG